MTGNREAVPREHHAVQSWGTGRTLLTACVRLGRDQSNRRSRRGNQQIAKVRLGHLLSHPGPPLTARHLSPRKLPKPHGYSQCSLTSQQCPRHPGLDTGTPPASNYRARWHRSRNGRVRRKGGKRGNRGFFGALQLQYRLSPLPGR